MFTASKNAHRKRLRLKGTGRRCASAVSYYIGASRFRCAWHLVLVLWMLIPALGVLANSRFAIIDPAAVKASIHRNGDWIVDHAPVFQCSDATLQQIYEFRWAVYHGHIVKTPDGYVVTEFLPNVPWAGKDNTISCAAGHHFYEGRWLTDSQFLNDYAVFWFRKGGDPRHYSFWAADAMWARYLANGGRDFVVGLLPDLIRNNQAWSKTHQDANGLFWQIDNSDGMEYSIGGSGYRPTINSYMYGDDIAIAKIAELAGKRDIAAEYEQKAAALKKLIQQKLWNPEANFFETVPRGEGKIWAGVREEVGFIPWYFNLPDPSFDKSWSQLLDPQGFAAPFGPPTAERRSPRFNFAARHDCLWNGPSWPYATTQTLVALANLLNADRQKFVSKDDYLRLLRGYAHSQYKDGHPWIAEDLDDYSGKWIVDLPRSVDYNHSAFCDLIITGLCGLRPRSDDTLEVNPLIPGGALDWFVLDGIPYHHHWITIVYDKTGQHFSRGMGLRVFCDGTQVGESRTIGRINTVLATAASH